MSKERHTEDDPKLRIGLSLSRLVDAADCSGQIYKTALHGGDYLLIKTSNSVYTIRALADGMFLASGGWFDRKGKSPMRVRITGCTWGGSAIKLNIAAARGLCLEFGNRVTTTPIQTIVLLPHGNTN